MDILYLIRSRREKLSGNAARIAEAVLDDVAFAAAASIDQLANKAGVSKAAMSRFARLMDCDDLRELRLKLARASRVGQRFLAGAATPVSPFHGQMLADIETSLRRHLDGLDRARLEAAVDLLAGARRIHAFGMGGCSTVFSMEVQYRLVRLGYPVSAYHDPVMMRMVASTCAEGDVLIVLSLTGALPDMPDILRLARGYGARILAITREDGPLAPLADVVLGLHLDETDFIHKPTAARYGMLLVIDLLATELALRNVDASQELLRRAKLALDEYRQDGDRLPLGD
ncbi:RpiR family transcriptional regulator [Pseudomonas sp. 1D4]|uniref:MurR/RpiR family transcriptional regulator n=1 Tax=Pseudomonadaceae TaxID=135621 RepID=UPI00084A9C54|nr:MULTISPECIES: MurR/RpiR family transcriptional regulator [Pseudomonas]OEC39579.1 RpiR family transcriptional regulator [Pseudomonas sp. 1D4]OEC59287.1 RpiR family transcriptional regulator [Pseudomonas sp. ENNP23]